MKYIAVLSKEHELLPFAELKAIIESESKIFNIKKIKNIAIFETQNETEVYSRAALLREGGRILGEFNDPEEIKMDLGDKSFSLRYRDFNENGIESKEMEKFVGSKIKGKVNLKNPEIKLLLIHMDKYYLAINERIDPDFNHRINEKRPFRTNLTLKPKMARMLVNLARVKKGDRIIDPFCGSGSILIEASLMDIISYGIDSSRKMYHGCRMNLMHFGIEPKVYLGDVSKALELGKFNAVVTDPPYGRGSSTNKENIESLYSRSFQIFRKIVDDGYISLMLPDERFIDLAKDYFKINEKYEMRVHRSLVRHIF
ncbi:MAG: N-6 DNA methylase, partial [Thermoplasmata archaeon]